MVQTLLTHAPSGLQPASNSGEHEFHRDSKARQAQQKHVPAWAVMAALLVEFFSLWEPDAPLPFSEPRAESI